MSKSKKPAKRDPLLISALQWIERNAGEQPMDHRVSVELKRGAEELDLLARGFHGLKFTELSYWLYPDVSPWVEEVHVQVSGSLDDLVRHGFLNAGQSEAVAKCKARKVFWDEQGACIEVRRNTSGFRVSCKVDIGLVAAVLVPHVWSPKAPLIR